MIFLLTEDPTLGKIRNPPKKGISGAPHSSVLKHYGGCLEEDAFYTSMKNDYNVSVYNLT
jgi:hypothetical protein